MIQKFNEYINNIRESLYHSIEYSDDFFDRKGYPFTNAELKKIDDFFDNFDPNYITEYKDDILVITYSQNFIANILKYDDEWFVLELMGDEDENYHENEYVYYKCDQIDGVISLLEYLFLYKVTD